MLNQYETIIILTPVLTEEMVHDCIQTYKDYIEQNGGKVQHEENWGMRKLAYQINKKRSGFYYLMDFEAPGSSIRPFETELKRDERVLRFMTVKMDKFHKEYALRRRQKIGKTETEKQAEA
jgi:small subunit ribosomal protein S6